MVPFIFFLSVLIGAESSGITLSRTTTETVTPYFNFVVRAVIDDSSSVSITLTDNLNQIVADSSSNLVQTGSNVTFTLYTTRLDQITLTATSTSFSGTLTITPARAQINITDPSILGSVSYSFTSSDSFSVIVTVQDHDKTTSVSKSSASLTISLIPGGLLSGTTTASATNGVYTFSGLKVLTAGSFYILAQSPEINPGISLTQFTVTNSLGSIIVTPSVNSVATGTSFTISYSLLTEDYKAYTPPCNVTITEETSGTTLGSKSTTGGSDLITVSISSNGVKSLVVTCGPVSGYSSILITSGSYVTLTYSGNSIVNNNMVFTSYLYDSTGNLVKTSQSGTLTGALGASGSGSSTTGIISYNVYFTASGSQTVTVLHGGFSAQATLTISKNVAILTPSQT